MCDGHSSARAKRLGRYFDTGRCLAAACIHFYLPFDNLTHYFFIISHSNDFINTLCILHVSL